MNLKASEADPVARLQREVRMLRVVVIAIVGAAAAVGVMAARAPGQAVKFDEITAHRLNIVEDDGTVRAVLTSGGRAPGPIIDGREGHRKFSLGGLIIYDRAGEEQGGYAVSDPTPGGTTAMTTLDYDRGEAVAMFRRIGKDGRGSGGLFLSDQPPPGATPDQAVSVDRRRIKLQNPDQNAEILLADTQGRDRIRLRVDKSGEARIEILDAQGRVVYRAPEAKGSPRR
jgi:hypothetical protein